MFVFERVYCSREGYATKACAKKSETKVCCSDNMDTGTVHMDVLPAD